MAVRVVMSEKTLCQKNKKGVCAATTAAQTPSTKHNRKEYYLLPQEIFLKGVWGKLFFSKKSFPQRSPPAPYPRTRKNARTTRPSAMRYQPKALKSCFLM